MSLYDYQKIPLNSSRDEDSDQAIVDASFEGGLHAPNQTRVSSALIIRVLPWILHVLLLSISTTLFVLARSTQDGCAETWLPLIGNHVPVRNVRLHGSLEFKSPFKGPPSPAVDEAWDEIVPLKAMSIPDEVFRTLNASKHAVRLPPAAGGGYMAIFEGIHLIHCVRSLWEATYPLYYVNQHNLSIEQPAEWHGHMDHCADMLRQRLMCDADAHLVTYNWLKNHYHPKPNFNVQHQCRNYQQLLDAANQFRADGSSFKDGLPLRPSDTTVVDFVEPPYDPEADE